MEIKEVTVDQTRKKRKKYYDEGKADIRYRGPLSYRTFKVLGWLCIVISQVVLLMKLDMKIDPYAVESLETPAQILSNISAMSVPFLLIANFALILNASEGYLRQIGRYFLTLSAVAGLSVFLYLRYAVGSAEVIVGDRTMAMNLLWQVIIASLPSGFLAYNLFVDLFLCALLMFFLHHRPKHVFTGKKVLIFRAFSILPILYELGCIVLKLLAFEKKITLPLLAFPFLTVKPPITFLVFLIMAVFIKGRERRFLRHGRSYEDYQEFLQTNRNSLHFSTFSAVLLAFAGILDILAGFVLYFYFLIKDPALAENSAVIVSKISSLGVGKSAALLLLSPLMLLFSYTRTHKHRLLDSFIPIVGIGLIVLVYLEGFFEFFQSVPVMIQNLINSL